MAYSELDVPDRADHLWRYTPWHRIHPSGEVSEIPDAQGTLIDLQSLDGSTEPAGITLEVATDEDLERLCINGKEDVSTQFIQALSEGNVVVLRVARKAKPSQPVLLNIECQGEISALHLLLDIGELAELELVTRITGEAKWAGILRQGIFGNACNVNDIVINHMGDGRLLRTDGIHLGRDRRADAQHGAELYRFARMGVALQHIIHDAQHQRRLVARLLRRADQAQR